MTEPTGPLKGFRILDLTTVLFGPFGTQTLGDWGAEIIKVESLTGDTWRTSGQFRNRGMSGQFMAANRNKRSIALDLKHPDGKAVLRRLIPTVDALVSNIRPAGLARRLLGQCSHQHLLILEFSSEQLVSSLYCFYCILEHSL